MMEFYEFLMAFVCGFYLRPHLWGFVADIRGNKHLDTIMYPVKKWGDKGGKE